MSDLTDPRSVIVVVLWLLWALLLFGGFVFGKLNAEATRRIPRWARMASSFTLAVAAWAWYGFAPVYPHEYSLLLAIGMTLGFVGDLFMAQLMPMKDYVLGGIAAFGLGHVAYIAAFLRLGSARNLFMDSESVRMITLIIWWLIALAGWYGVVFRGQRHTILHYAALPYALLLATTAGLATGVALQAPIFVPLVVGTALFLLSDLILAAQLFNGLHFKLIGDVVWLTYGPAQMLIVYSIGTILLLPLFVPV